MFPRPCLSLLFTVFAAMSTEMGLFWPVMNPHKSEPQGPALCFTGALLQPLLPLPNVSFP
jgi:hypothetical protein